MGRIKLEDTGIQAITKMAEGNPGAASVLTNLVRATPIVDPDIMLGGMHYILFMDDLAIYGPRIWVLFKDVCGSDIVKVIAVLRARQIGFVPVAAINTAIDTARFADAPKFHLDIDDLMEQVKEAIPNFAVSVPA